MDETFVSVTTVLQARLNIVNFYGETVPDAIHKLLELAGSTELKTVRGHKNYGFNFSPGSARKIEAIAGPHWYTMLKAMEARKGVGNGVGR